MADIANQGPSATGATFSLGLWSDDADAPGMLLDALTPSATNNLVTATSGVAITLSADTAYWLMVTNSRRQFFFLGADTVPTGSGATYLGLKQSDPSVASAPGQNARNAVPSSGFTTGMGPYLLLEGTAVSASAPEASSSWLMLAAGIVMARLARRRGFTARLRSTV